MTRYSCEDIVVNELRRRAQMIGIDHSGRRGPWAPWLRPSDDARVGWGLVIAQWPKEGDRAPGAKSLPSADAEAWLRAAAAATTDAYVRLCSCARPVSEGAIADLAATGIRRTPHQLSELLATQLLAAHSRLGKSPAGNGEISVIIDAIVSRVRSVCLPLERAAFAAATGERYDQLWAERGAATLRQFRPSAVGLGANRRPPLLPDETAAARGRSGLALGTDRSVYGRYVMHYQVKARSRQLKHARLMSTALVNGRAPDDDRRPWPTDPHERIGEELERVCSPYGLAMPEHQGVVVAVAHGADMSTPAEPERAGRRQRLRGEWTAWRRSPEPLLPAHQGLADAVRDFVDLWRHTDEAMLLAGRYGELENHVAVIGSAAVCKLWMDLHRREREHTTPASRTSVARYIRVAFDTTVPHALGRWVGPEEVDNEDDEPSGQPSDAAIDYLMRRNTTALRLLDAYRSSSQEVSQIGRWRAAIESGDHELVHRAYATFLERTVTAGIPAERFLTTSELIDWLHHEGYDQS